MFLTKKDKDINLKESLIACYCNISLDYLNVYPDAYFFIFENDYPNSKCFFVFKMVN